MLLFSNSALIGGSLVASTIWGSILRWKDSGSACAEDVLKKSGKFMMVWLIIEYVLDAIAICIVVMVWPK